MSANGVSEQQAMLTRVREIVSGIAKVPLEEVGLDVDLRRELNLDSLLALQIVAAIEHEYHVLLPEDEIVHCSSVRLIVESIERVRAP